jgi:hypothetical protein
MDHEKPQALYPHVYEYEATPTQTTASPEPMMRPPSIDELEYVEDRRERRGDSLW